MLLYKILITFIIFILSVNGQTCPCSPNGNILTCTTTNIASSVDTNLCSSYEYNSINIIYNGNVTLNLITSSTYPIVIKPLDENDNHILQIFNILTNATRIEIQIRLSSNQILLPLFLPSSNVRALTSTLSINVIQIISNINDFKIFEISSTSIMDFAYYEVKFNSSVANPGTLNFPNLIRGLKNISSITIIGNNHLLAVDSSQMPSSMNINQLTLKNLRLFDQILYNISNLKEYYIEECEYNRTARFLYSNVKNNISITMKNNNPLNLVLPYEAVAFDNFGTLISATLIEPKLTSSCLKAFKKPEQSISLYLQLGTYDDDDFSDWKDINRPRIRELTIKNISNLEIFPSKLFNIFDPLERVVLEGPFNLEKEDICAFVGINIQPIPKPPIVILDSPKNNTQSWDECADTYIKAINQRSSEGVYCPPNNTNNDCERWADKTNKCDLISVENGCPGRTITFGNNIFLFNRSYLYEFFQKHSWLNQTTRPPTTYVPKEDGMNIGAIIGAVCGLIAAIIILGTTIFCIYRYRQKNSMGNTLSKPEEKYRPSSDDATHVSIATSKTSKSSRYALQKSFFPPMQPNDEIAPPLYTAPSESVGSRSAYNAPSAPAAPRDSIMTHGTHVYETVVDT